MRYVNPPDFLKNLLLSETLKYGTTYLDFSSSLGKGLFLGIILLTAPHSHHAQNHPSPSLAVLLFPKYYCLLLVFNLDFPSPQTIRVGQFP